MRVAGTALSLALAGCVAVPDAGVHPAMETAASIEAGQTLAERGNATWPPDQWWRLAGDPQLNALIEEGLANSPQVAVAMARVRRAEAEAQRAGAARLPTIGAEAEGGMRRQSGNNGIPAQFLPDGWKDYGQTSLSFGFDLDLWGRNRAAYAAATSETRAAVVDAAQARLVLSVAISAAYAELGRHYRERDNAAAMLGNRQTTRDLVAQRQRNGLDNLASLRRADAEVALAEQDLAAVEENIGLRRNQLAALVGAGPDRGRSITRPPLTPSTPAWVPEGVNTDLLGRRPDIVAARDRVEAAESRVKVARAGFFPSINLRALIGFQSLGLGNLVDSGSLFGSVGPAISLPIFQGGAIKAQYGGAWAAYDEAVANYNQTVVTAYQQAADAVTQRDAADKRLGAARMALTASEDALGLVRKRYEAGLASYLDVLASERGVQDLRLAVIGLETYERGATLAMIRALGGGFDASKARQAGQTNQ
ncbi:NodT family efflux transporter outer membrane factor (OMF) lipoprotein [Novosphingobium kunmingense]|uniref:NodT family efflux transporter outer membrane factor (OMF) lipoprotein n=1 Tax=Novosphingobium kunmingense TaxID=1211806 RepID=A0A2N0H3X9_9SPHN|nr:NodT family efflux transporter outer membrane factor (OMF) lipoprotein [Novosphingobium kunmingense]